MNEKSDWFDISAEFLLNFLHPEKQDEWIAYTKGVFGRNYSSDLLSYSVEDSMVNLSRNGFLELLPPGLFATGNELLGEDFKGKYDELVKKKALFRDLFRPEDTIIFRNRLHLEREASKLLQEKLSYLLKAYFQYDWEAETNPLVKKAAPLLLLVKKRRADFGFIKNLLRSLLHADIEMKVGQYRWGEDEDQAQPEVRYNVLISDLTSERYKELNACLEPLKDFLVEWFIPFDTKCEIAIKQHGTAFHLDQGLVLDYNTETN